MTAAPHAASINCNKTWPQHVRCLQEYLHPARPVGSPPYRGQQADSPCHASKSAEPATTTFNADGACNGQGSQNRGLPQSVGLPLPSLAALKSEAFRKGFLCFHSPPSAVWVVLTWRQLGSRFWERRNHGVLADFFGR